MPHCRMQHVRIGVAGVGGMGSFHARTLASLAGVDLVGVADPDRGNRETLRDELGCAEFEDHRALMETGDLDGLVIASPDATHAELALAGIDAGIRVLCEKPLATTVADARRVTETEIAAGARSVQLGFMREYDPAHAQLFAELAELGRIDAVRAVHRNVRSTPRPVDVIVGQSMVHDIHSVRFITGAEIVAVRASASGPHDSPLRHLVALCTLSSGAHAVLEFDDHGFAYEVGIEVVAEHGDILTGPPTRPIRRRDGSIDIHLGADWFSWFATAYRIQDQAWVDSIRSGRTVGPSAWDGLVAQQVVEAILGSLATGDTIRLESPDRPGIYASQVSGSAQAGRDFGS